MRYPEKCRPDFSDGGTLQISEGMERGGIENEETGQE